MPAAPKASWRLRRRHARSTAAIATHTNAFKINEDVVIPLDRLGDYTDGIERINIELSIGNKLALCDGLEAALGEPFPLALWGAHAEELPPPETVAAKLDEARAVIAAVRLRWQDLQDRIGQTFPALQDHSVVVSWKSEIKAPLEDIFAGIAFAPILKRCIDKHREVLRGRVFVALHMHAGDGNVHSNIPVNSDNYAMLREAHAAVARIMALARRLDGVISGEHGIGITKLEFVTDDELAAFTEYKARIDPEGRFNKGKLLRGTMGESMAADLSAAYTPSFGLMGHESLIMQQ